MVWGILHELGRKIIHITILFVLGAYFLIKDYLINSGYSTIIAKQVAMLFLVSLLILFLILEYVRLELGWKLPFFSQFIRPKEQNRMYGVIYFLSATIICLAVFDPRIALTALLMTTFGDMTAALVGKKYGTTLIYRNKTWAGFIGELIINTIVGFVILSGLFRSVFLIVGINLPDPISGGIYIILGMAIIATVVETLVDELDDNLLIPIFSGFIGQVIVFSL